MSQLSCVTRVVHCAVGSLREHTPYFSHSWLIFAMRRNKSAAQIPRLQDELAHKFGERFPGRDFRQISCQQIVIVGVLEGRPRGEQKGRATSFFDQSRK